VESIANHTAVSANIHGSRIFPDVISSPIRM